MRIGILTPAPRVNYGGIMQAYALQTVLEQMGHDVKIIYTPRKPWGLPLWEKPFAYTKRFLRKYLLRRGNRVFVEQYENEIFPLISQHTQRFVDKYIHLFHVDNFSQLKEDDFDAIVVGSDQIWRPKYYDKIEESFLSFAHSWKIKRIAYAASFGTDEWEYTPAQTTMCANLVKLFDTVTVREESGVSLCKKHLGIAARHVLDPTLLLTQDDYLRLIQQSDAPKSSGTLFHYILDDSPTKQSIIRHIANERNLTPFHVNGKVYVRTAPLENRIQSSVEQWLRGFMDAEFVVTDSFHGCVFSILFKKPFVVIGNEKRGMARFQSLLKTFGLENRLITADAITHDTPINWNAVYTRIEEKRKESMKELALLM